MCSDVRVGVRADNPQIWTNCRHHFHLACIYEWCGPTVLHKLWLPHCDFGTTFICFVQ